MTVKRVDVQAANEAADAREIIQPSMFAVDQKAVAEKVKPKTPVPTKTAHNGKTIRSGLKRDKFGDPQLTETLTAALVALIEDGCTLDNAARVCGLRRTLLEKWIEKGRHDVEEQPPVVSDEATLARELDAALGDQEYLLSRAVMQQAGQDPRLALETLSRRRPADWAPAQAEAPDMKKKYAALGGKEAMAEIERLMKAAERDKK